MIIAAFNKLDVYNTGLENFISVQTSEKKGIIVVSQCKKDAIALLEQEYPDCSDIEVFSIKDVGLIRGLRFILKLPISLVHAHHNKAVLYGILLNFRRDIKFIITIHSNFKHYPLLTKLAFLLGMICSNAIICNSFTTKKSLPRYVRSSKIVTVIYNGVNTDKLNNRPNEVQEKDTAYTLCVVARLVPEKNIIFLIEAINNSSVLRDLKVKLKIIGDGPIATDLQKYVCKNNIGNISFLGSLSRDSVYSELRSSHLFVLSSRWEGFCNAMVEALVSGLKCAVPDIETLREVGKDAHAYFYKSNDLTSFEQLVAKLVKSNPISPEDISSVVSKYSLTTSCSKHSLLYQSIIDNKGIETVKW